MIVRRAEVAVGIDVFFVIVFVAGGRRTHDQDPGIAGLVETAAPFLIGLAAGWLIARAWRAPVSFTSGATIWIATVAVGMMVRRWVFDDGTATSFIVVTTAFLAACLIGWRLLVRLLPTT